MIFIGNGEWMWYGFDSYQKKGVKEVKKSVKFEIFVKKTIVFIKVNLL